MSAVWIYAEYCDSDLFMGWHLYERDRNDGSRNDDGGWGWFRHDFPIRNVAELLPQIELPPPPYQCHMNDEINWANKFILAFQKMFPQGLRVEKIRWGHYALEKARELGE